MWVWSPRQWSLHSPPSERCAATSGRRESIHASTSRRRLGFLVAEIPTSQKHPSKARPHTIYGRSRPRTFVGASKQAYWWVVYTLARALMKREAQIQTTKDSETVTRLFDAAEQFFGEYGFNGVGMRALRAATPLRDLEFNNNILSKLIPFIAAGLQSCPAAPAAAATALPYPPKPRCDRTTCPCS